MKNKRERLGIISEILRMQVIGSQEELLDILRAKGYDVTMTPKYLLWRTPDNRQKVA